MSSGQAAISARWCRDWRTPFSLYDKLKRDAVLARRMGRSLGLVLAEQHARIRRDDVTPWLRTRVSWPEPGILIRSRLPNVVDDFSLIGEVEAVLRSYEEASAASE